MKKYSGDFPIAVHPGEILQEMIEENGMSQAALARHLKVDPSKINEICKGRRGISTEMAVILGKAFSTSPSLWIDLQKNWELSQVNSSSVLNITPIRKRA